jgi:hypothetical protein
MMNKHVDAWLEAYHDGELREQRLVQVEAHLEKCKKCIEELEKLSSLSALLQENPSAIHLTTPDRFVARVGLYLPRRPHQSSWLRRLRGSWYLVPGGLLSAWAFLQTVMIVAGGLNVARRFGLGEDLVISVIPAQQESIITDISQFVLDVLGIGGSIGLGVSLNLLLPAAIGLIYMAWLAGWLVSQPRQQFTNGNS